MRRVSQDSMDLKRGEQEDGSAGLGEGHEQRNGNREGKCARNKNETSITGVGRCVMSKSGWIGSKPDPAEPLILGRTLLTTSRSHLGFEIQGWR